MRLPEILEFLSTYIKSHAPAVIFLKGELGAGKTYLTTQLAHNFGVTETITSPTFTFLQEYTCHTNIVKKLVHCDFYRVTQEDAKTLLEQICFWDYLDEHSLIIIEWPEKIGDELNEIPHIEINISQDEDNERNYEITQ